MKEYNEVRDFGQILFDPLKIIFRNLKAISSIVILAIVLPNLIVTYMYLKFSVFDVLSNPSERFDNFDNGIYYLIIFLIVGFFMYSHISLVSASVLRVGIEDGQSNITSKRVNYYFKKLYLKNFALSGLVLITFIFFYGIGLLFIFNETFGLGILIFAFGFFSLFLFFLPLFFYAQRYYLLEDENGFLQSLNKGREDLLYYYGITIGVLFVSSIVSSFLQYMILLPFGIIFMVLGFGIGFDFEGSKYADIVIFVQSLFLAVGLSYLYLYFYVTIYLKGTDLSERRTGIASIEKIKQIDISRETYFENEGEY